MSGRLSLPVLGNITQLFSTAVLFFFLYKHASIEFVTAFIVALVVFQVGASIVRFGFESKGIIFFIDGDRTQVVSNITLVKTFLAAISFVIIFAVVSTISFENFYQEKTIIFLCFGLFPEAIINHWAVIASKKYNKFTLLRILVILFTLALQIAVLEINYNPNAVVILRVFQLLLEGLISAFLLKKYLNIKKVSRLACLYYIKGSYNYFMGSLINTITYRLNHIYLAKISPLGIINQYDIFYKLVKLIEMPFVMTQTVLLPDLRKNRTNFLVNTIIILVLSSLLAIIVNVISPTFFFWYTSNKVAYDGFLTTMILAFIPLTNCSCYLGAELVKHDMDSEVKTSEIINFFSIVIFAFIIYFTIKIELYYVIIVSQTLSYITVILYKSFWIFIYTKNNEKQD